MMADDNSILFEMDACSLVNYKLYGKMSNKAKENVQSSKHL